MESTTHKAPQPAPEAGRAHTTPKDFFLWLGAVIALYGSVTAFLTLLFQYINEAYPDPLAYSPDVYSGPIRAAMATLLVLTPTLLALLLAIRRGIVRMPSKADIWVRKWALVLTIFLASATAAIDLITLLTTFLGGELSVRFVLKAIVVLLLAIFVSLHFLADLKGYWTLHRRKVNIVGAAVGAVAIMTIAAGFYIIGTPSHMRMVRADQQKVSDLENIQSQVVTYWQQQRTLPTTLANLNDPLQNYSVPNDPSTGAPYEYKRVTDTTFELCSTFEAQSEDVTANRPYDFDAANANFSHAPGHTCFSRTIDPSKYPPAPASVASPVNAAPRTVE